MKNNNLIEDFKKHEAKIMEVLKEAAKTEEKLTKEMFHMVDKKSVKEVEIKMSALIGQDRVNLIKKAFCIETYQMKLVKKSNGQMVVQVHRGGAEFRPEMNLATILDVDASHVLQWASIVVEIFMLVLSCVGIGVDLDEAEMKAVTEEVEVIVREPAFQRALNKFLEEWNQGGAWRRAKAIFYLIKDTYSLGFFWRIVKLIFNDMSTWEKIRALAEVSLMIVAAFASDGLALIARIALAVDNAVYLAQKLINISELTERKKTL